MFEDVNHNGVYDEGTDILLEGVRVVISNGTVTFTVYTDSAGFYSQVLPSAGNWTVTKDDVAYAASDNSAQLTKLDDAAAAAEAAANATEAALSEGFSAAAAQAAGEAAYNAKSRFCKTRAVPQWNGTSQTGTAASPPRCAGVCMPVRASQQSVRPFGPSVL